MQSLTDTFGRTITYLRVSVTDRCNLRCTYCMPEEGIRLLQHEDILRFEEIEQVVRVAAEAGITKVRLTGGEPLVRRGLLTLVAKLAGIPGVRDLALTTNGILLAAHAQALAAAGLHRINVSLDSVDAARFATITRGGQVQAVLEGIEAARAAGLHPIKVNCVVRESGAEPDAVSVARYCRERDLQVRFIRLMDHATGNFSMVEGGGGGDCPRCNRLRLSADGMIRPCLFSDLGYSVRALGIGTALRQAVLAKPERGGPVETNWIRAVGG